MISIFQIYVNKTTYEFLENSLYSSFKKIGKTLLFPACYSVLPP